MILDGQHDVDEEFLNDVELIDEDDDEAGEWLDGLRHAGLPITTPGPVNHRDGIRAELRERVVERASHAKSAGSRIAAAKGFRDFGSWCAAHGLEWLPAEPLTVAAYLDDLARQAGGQHTAPAESRDLLHAPRRRHDGPHRRRDRRRNYRWRRPRSLRSPRDQAVPLLLEDLRRVITGREPNDPIVRRDQTLLALGWATALRPSELVALVAADLQFFAPTERPAGGMIVHVGRSKTDQTAVGDDVAVPYSLHWSTCPVRLAQLQLRHTASGPLLRALDNRGHGRRLHANNVALIVRRYVQLVLQVGPTMYSGHSLRAGFATEASDHGVEPAPTQRQMRQKDPRSLRHYTRPSDLLARPALAGEWC